MSDTPDPIAEADLHAYVDGQLSPQRHAAVQRHLDMNADDARRVAEWTAQRDALRAALATLADEPLPPHLSLLRLMEQRLQRRRVPWLAAASVLLALALGGAGGWMFHTPEAPARVKLAMSLLEQQAVATHTVYAADKRHPIEVAASEKDHLAQWLSNRLSRSVRPPDLEASGYHLIGGRLLATESGGAAALFMYQNDHGDRLSLVLRPMSRDLHAAPADMKDGTMNVCAWIADGMGYAVIATLPDSELETVTDSIRAKGG